MKVKLSITLDNETSRLIDEQVATQRFRNKSHAIEYAILKMLENKLSEKKTQLDSKNLPISKSWGVV